MKAIASSNTAATLPRRASLGAYARSGTALAAGTLVVLLVVSFMLRTRSLAAHFWIDEGLSVGIASHALTDIPGLLRQDGSPPLYYLLLHEWMRAFGTGETATHALSLLFGLLAFT
jgi:mannosyltransferase